VERGSLRVRGLLDEVWAKKSCRGAPQGGSEGELPRNGGRSRNAKDIQVSLAGSQTGTPEEKKRKVSRARTMGR